ncbi:hypothetical protein RND81_12G193200 [Saponaria officinalis]|uniref:PHD finger protein n=1 Tax=Saponaria officinalis TaxID=3572 RepID=A0AAW1HCT3_SAPOF
MTSSPHNGGVDGSGGGGGKRGVEVGVGGGSDAKRRRVAEIVLVLSAMGKMRGGRDPTVAEKAMMAEAKKKVVSLCEEFSPKDIVPREAFCGVIDDLGLNRLKDQRLGFRPPKLSISDKIALSKRRMEESKAFAAQPALHPSHRQSEAASEIRGTPTSDRVLSADKVGHVSVSTGSFQPPTPVIPTPAVQTTHVPQTSPAVRVSAAASTPFVASTPVTRSARKESTSVLPTRTDRAHIRPDGRLNGPSAVPQVPETSLADRHTVRPGPVHMQPQPSSRISAGAKPKAPDQLPLRVGNTSGPQMTAQPPVVQTPKPNVQTVPGTMPTMHHPVQGLQYAHPQVINPHAEICKVVQRVLNPNLPKHPTWTPPSRDYMNKAHPCQFCKLIINEVETVVICDACEKAFHLGCLQSHNVKGIPRGEWHCPRCVAMSHGKPFPPKYGRVTRNMNAPKGPSNTSVAHFPSEKKIENVNEMTQPKATTNGILNIRTQSQAVNVAEPPYKSNMSSGIDSGRVVMSSGIKKEIVHNMSGPNNRKGSAMDASLSNSTGSSSDIPPQQVMKSEASRAEDVFISETESSTPVITQANSRSENFPSSSNQNDVDQKMLNCAESPLFKHSDSNGVLEVNQSYSKERCEKDGAKQNLVVTDRVQDNATEVVATSEGELHNVTWIGEIDKVVGGKRYFRSCCINGVIYHVQNYALFRSASGKLTPFKLQGMWEDSQTSSNWLLVHRCYFPDDLPGEVGRPGAPQINEVYESTHDSSVMAGSIQGPCEVLPFRKFGEEADRSDPTSQGNEKIGPVFIRNWFYDESKRAFCPSAS